MLYHGFRNLALLSGFAWHDGERWVLRQRGPLALALPLTFADGVRKPEHLEAIDVIGHIASGPDGLALQATFLDRAAVSSFPMELEWNVRGVRHTDPMFPDHPVCRDVRDLAPGTPDVAAEVLSGLLAESHYPEGVCRVLERDPDTAAWLHGARFKHRLPNSVLLTGMTGRVREHTSHSGSPYYAIDLQTDAPPASPIRLRLTMDTRGWVGARHRLVAFSMIPMTVTGQFMVKVRPNEDGTVRTAEPYIRITDVVRTDRDDFDTIPQWTSTWRTASRPRLSDLAETAL
ncbi:MAG TPA: hypothetical protein VFQ88_02935 [Nevskiaceae bacterium]|nr:hypothetical protein [Nevskiaceae bacterium]